MANGDTAAAAGMDIVPGTAPRSQGYDEINKTRDYMALQPVTRGGTGATTGDAAITNLGGVHQYEVFDGTGNIFGKIPRYDGAGRLIVATPILDNEAASKVYVDARLRAYLDAIADLTARVEALEHP